MTGTRHSRRKAGSNRKGRNVAHRQAKMVRVTCTVEPEDQETTNHTRVGSIVQMEGFFGRVVAMFGQGSEAVVVCQALPGVGWGIEEFFSSPHRDVTAITTIAQAERDPRDPPLSKKERILLQKAIDAEKIFEFFEGHPVPLLPRNGDGTPRIPDGVRVMTLSHMAAKSGLEERRLRGMWLATCSPLLDEA